MASMPLSPSRSRSIVSWAWRRCWAAMTASSLNDGLLASGVALCAARLAFGLCRGVEDDDEDDLGPPPLVMLAAVADNDDEDESEDLTEADEGVEDLFTVCRCSEILVCLCFLDALDVEARFLLVVVAGAAGAASLAAMLEREEVEMRGPDAELQLREIYARGALQRRTAPSAVRLGECAAAAVAFSVVVTPGLRETPTVGRRGGGRRQRTKGHARTKAGAGAVQFCVEVGRNKS